LFFLLNCAKIESEDEAEPIVDMPIIDYAEAILMDNAEVINIEGMYLLSNNTYL